MASPSSRSTGAVALLIAGAVFFLEDCGPNYVAKVPSGIDLYADYSGLQEEEAEGTGLEEKELSLI